MIQAQITQPVLRSVGEVHALAAKDAAGHLPVDLIATVTYYDPLRHVFFVEDRSGAVYINSTKTYPVHRGDLVEIIGTTQDSFRSVVRWNPEVRVLGRGHLPPSTLLGSSAFRELMSGKWDCRLTTLQGTVRSALIDTKDPGKLDLELLVYGGIVEAEVQFRGDLDAERLVDAEVTVSGVVGADYNAKWQLIRPVFFATDAGDLKVLREPGKSPADLPLTSVAALMQTRSVVDNTQRVRVRGTVTFYRPARSVVIQQAGSSVSAATRQHLALPLGSVVDVTGFAAEGDYGPMLKQATILPTGQVEAIAPQPVTYASAIGGAYNDELVSMRGKLLRQTHTDSSDSLTLLTEGHAITVALTQPIDGRWQRSLPAGTEVEVSGICHVTLTDATGTTPLYFYIDMRSADDLRVLAWPSWWTLGHVFLVLALVCVLALLITLWAFVLRHRVSRQTRKIEQAMRLEKERSRLLEAISSDTPLADVLADIASTFESLLSRVHCRIWSHNDGELDLEAAQEILASDVGGLAPGGVHHVLLKDSRGAMLGRFQAEREDGRALSKYEIELLEAAAALSALAVNQRSMYQELNYTSTHDQLTGLPNRRMADGSLERALQESTQNRSLVAVAYIDVNHFKRVNDQYGHKTGDLYLQQIASRLSGAVRRVDTVARIGGDEFLLIATCLQSVDDAEACRKRLEQCFEQPFLLDGITLAGSASIGLAVSSDHATRSEDLKRKADADMYAVKQKHHKESHPAEAAKRPGRYSAEDLETALYRDQFCLFYQPQFSFDGNLYGLEALLRLNDPVLGIVSPDAFIDVAEQNVIVHSLGEWVLRQALADAVRWGLANRDVRVIVNVSARQVEHAGFAELVFRALEDANLSSKILELEITERMLMRNMTEAVRQLERLRERGVQIAIDDFGIEHSCLSQLHRLPCDTIKLDREFIRSLCDDSQTFKLVGAIVSMAHALGKRTVAEGVETEAQFLALATLDRVDLQGYYFSRPRPSKEIFHALKTWQHAAKPASRDSLLLSTALRSLAMTPARSSATNSGQAIL